MKHPADIVMYPVITEKSTDNVLLGRYTFRVAMSANKIEIARAIEVLYKVDVIKVNVITTPGRAKRVGRGALGRTSDTKKAIVTIKPGQRIDAFEMA